MYDEREEEENGKLKKRNCWMLSSNSAENNKEMR